MKLRSKLYTNISSSTNGFILLICLLTFISNSSSAQQSAEEIVFDNLVFTLQRPTAFEQKQIDSIIKALPPLKEPQENLWAKLCYCVDSLDPWYKRPLMLLAGVVSTDSRLVIQAKVQRLWNIRYKDFGCDSTGFPIEYGNILKFAVHKGYSEFIDSLIHNFGAIDINKKDPSDGKTLLDFVNDEVLRWGR